MTPQLDYVALLPEFTLAGAIVLLFVADLIVDDHRKQWLAPMAALLLLFPLASVIALAASDHHTSMVHDTYVVDPFALTVKGVAIACALGIALLGIGGRWRGEYYFLMLSATLGVVMIPSSRDLITFFVAFELLAIPGYLLAGWRKRSMHGHEAALKYYLLGIIATAVMLYGLSLLFGSAGATGFDDVAAATSGTMSSLAMIAVVFTVAGMIFKIAAVPFHFWAPDAYQGAPLPVAAFLAVVSKLGGLAALVILIAVAFPQADQLWAPMLWAVAAVTMTVANLVALRQKDLIRLLAWSSIAQAGFLLVPLTLTGAFGGSVDLGVEAMVIYVIYYALATVAAFAVAIAVARTRGTTSISAVRGLFAAHPRQAVALAIALLSLAGIPPLGGWFAKFAILRVVIEADTGWALALGVIVAINTAIALVYYAVVTRQMWLSSEHVAADEGDNEVPEGYFGQRVLTVVLPVAIVVTGVLPGLVTFVGGATSLGM